MLAFTFDTTGLRTRVVTRQRDVPDEDVHDYRRTDREETSVSRSTDDRTVAEELSTRHDDRETVATGVREERVEIRDPDRRDTT